jgi:hypothetical protein
LKKSLIDEHIPNSPVFYARMLRAKDKMMRLLGLFQQADILVGVRHGFVTKIQ